VKDEFDVLPECGILAHGFLRLRCGDCDHDKRVAFSCTRRALCPSCGVRQRALAHEQTALAQELLAPRLALLASVLQGRKAGLFQVSIITCAGRPRCRPTPVSWMPWLRSTIRRRASRRCSA